MARTEPEDLEKQLRFHRREWRIQRVGWVFVAIFLALAFAGLFGGGPLSRARASGAAGFVEYQRFVRKGAPTELVVTPSGSSHGVSRVEITSEYLEALRIVRITPEPATVRISGARLVYEFAAAAPGASVTFHIDPQHLWRHEAQVTIDGGAPLQIWQLTYP